MLKVYWDTTLPPQKSVEEQEVKRWDSWFSTAGIGEEWNKIKAACAQIGCTHRELIRWAQITELTRLESVISDKESHDGSSTT